MICNLEFRLPSISEQLHLPIDPNTDWGISKIVCQKVVDRERHYQARWEDTWMTKSELVGAKELVDAFDANDGGKTMATKRPATELLETRGNKEPKKRGRPRKPS